MTGMSMIHLQDELLVHGLDKIIREMGSEGPS